MWCEPKLLGKPRQLGIVQKEEEFVLFLGGLGVFPSALLCPLFSPQKEGKKVE